MKYKFLRTSGNTLESESKRKAGRKASRFYSEYHELLQLQKTIGNRSIARLFRGAPRSNGNEDPYEKEAVRTARYVTAMSLDGSGAQLQGGLLGANNSAGQMGFICPSSINDENPAKLGLDMNRGKPLPDDVRAYFEPRFGYNLSDVRIHDDDQGADLAQAQGSRVFAVGNHVVFNRGEFAPSTADGRTVIAHELTHVIQQAGTHDRIGSTGYKTGKRTGEPLQGSPGPARAPAHHPKISKSNQLRVSRLDLPSWESIREEMYSGLISGLRSLQSGGIRRLRAMADRNLSGTQRTIANGIITALEGISEIFIRLIFAVVGLVVGFVAGIVQMVVGLIRLIYGIIEGILLFLYGFFDGGERFDRWANEVLDAITAIPSALRALVNSWITEFEQASEERQTIMIGELTGQILAIIATLGVAAARAGAAPRLVARFGGGGSRLSLATAGRAPAIVSGTGAVTIDVATPAAATAVSGSVAMSITEAQAILGEGPEVEAVQESSRTRAGMSRRPRHHIFPQEHRSFFRRRGFSDIDDFTVELEQAHHQALHGGGNWRLGRTWPGEWNRRIMAELRETERFMGRQLTREEIITIGRELMIEYGIEGPFLPY